MPLLDHFRPPLSKRRRWHAFLNAWATCIAANLNQRLPEAFFAEPNVQYGIEIPVGAPAPEPGFSVPMVALTDVVEVPIFSTAQGPTMVAVIELVSPSNKERPASRGAFVGKCAACLQSGLGLVVIDIVTEYTFNLHQELMDRVSSPSPEGSVDGLYAAAYRPARRDGQTMLDVWPETLRLGEALPVLPLCLRVGPTIPLALEESYMRTLETQRISS